ncbi:MAG: hypothetical protein K8L97_16895 [Anaerolineae bacterium]|nr:hypothetical protein [Anaerolineae bacterium]
MQPADHAHWKVFLLPAQDYPQLRALFSQTGFELIETGLDLARLPELTDSILLVESDDQQTATTLRAVYDYLVPIIVLTSREEGSRALDSGAWDYLVKDDLNRDTLLRALRYVTYQHWILTQLNARTHELHAAQSLFQNLVSRNTDVILVVDGEGVIQYSNPAAEKTFARVDLVGSAFGIPVTSGDTVELSVVGSPAVLEMRAMPTEWDNHPAYLLTLRDITEKKAIQESMLEQERLRIALDEEKEMSRVKSRFMYTISHEFRTPLAMIMAASELLLHYFESMTEDKRRFRLNTIQTQIRHLDAMIDEVSLVVRAEWGKLEFQPVELDFHEFSQHVVDDVKSTIGIEHTILFSALEGDYHMRGDRKLLRHILHNLLSNAVKYSDPGSTIRFDLAQRPGEIIFSVRDQGIGIPAEDQKRLSEAFYRATNVGAIGGTGLGLKVVKDCLVPHKGTLEIESRVGEGTRCIVRFAI